MWILIPAYEPDHRLVDLVARLAPEHPVLVVDDGSGPGYLDVFEACAGLGAFVAHHDVNLGKAAALRTGFAWIEAHAPGSAIVCADSDGQHRPEDIAQVGAELLGRARAGLPYALVLGSRQFVGAVPLRSRIGNRATTAMVAAASGTRIADTQTGLRGYPASLVPWARTVRGERFAYELQVLLDASRAGVPVVEVPIATVYLDGNASSHFRPLVDSARVLWPLALFAASSLLAFVVDTVALLALTAATGSLAISVVGARLLSGGVNFALNRRAVFGSRERLAGQAARYVALAVVLVLLSYASLRTLTEMGVPLLAAKIATDAVLWLASYGFQRTMVFPAGSTSSPIVSTGRERARLG